MASSLDLKQVLYTITHEITRLLDVEGCENSDWDQIKEALHPLVGYHARCFCESPEKPVIWDKNGGHL